MNFNIEEIYKKNYGIEDVEGIILTNGNGQSIVTFAIYKDVIDDTELQIEQNNIAVSITRDTFNPKNICIRIKSNNITTTNRIGFDLLSYHNVCNKGITIESNIDFELHLLYCLSLDQITIIQNYIEFLKKQISEDNTVVKNVDYDKIRNSVYGS